MTPCV